jgi:uracil-DNA glycosylase
MPDPDVAETLEQAAAAARACTLCADRLPLGPRPTFRVSATARLLIVSQAPGTKVHATGIPFNDASGDRLRAWMGIDRATFYDASRVALVPMGLCYPGRLPQGGDVPPMKVCAPTWHPRLIPRMPAIRLTLLVGGYAIARVLGPGGMGAHVWRFRDHLPQRLPLPHPSWRTVGWEAANPWFTQEVLPDLRARVADLLAGDAEGHGDVYSA